MLLVCREGERVMMYDCVLLVCREVGRVMCDGVCYWCVGR